MRTIELDDEKLGYLKHLLRQEILAGEHAEDRYGKLSDEDRTREEYYAVANAKDSAVMAQRLLQELAQV